MAKLIYNDKVYTSFFDAVDKYVLHDRQVSIAISSKPTFKGSTFEQLAPPRWLRDGYKKTKKITKEDFERIYYEEVLSKLDPILVYMELKGKVLLCWEKRGYFCHRHLVMKWLKESLGEESIGGEL